MAQITKFKSGLSLCVQPKRNTRSISIGVFVGAGSVYENESNRGIAHFIEHMCFKGTKRFTAFEIADNMEKIGVNMNAFTTKNMTAYYTIGMDNYADECMDLLADLYFNSTFTEENIAKEKGVVLEEINMYEDSGEDLCADLLCEAHFGSDSLLSYPVLGFIDTVKSFTRQDILDFMSDYYLPSNTVISVSGNISKKDAIALVEKYFESKMTYKPFKRPKLSVAIPQKTYKERIKPIEQANVCIAFTGANNREPMSIIDHLVCNIMSGGMSSRLFQKIREELGLVYNIMATAFQYYSDGYNELFFATSPKQVKKAILAIRECILDTLTTGFTAEEITKTIIQFKSAMVLGCESSATVMRINGKDVLNLKKSLSTNAKIAILESITPDDINRRLREIFVLEDCSLSYVGQKLNFDPLKLFKEGKC